MRWTALIVLTAAAVAAAGGGAWVITGLATV